MTGLQLYAYRCATPTVAEETARELSRVHGFTDVEAVGPLVVWPSTFEGASFSGLVVASVARVMALFADPASHPTQGENP